VLDSLARLHRGDVIEVPGGRFAGYAVVLDRGTSPDGPRPQVLTAERQARRLSVVDFPEPVAAVSRLRIPRQFNPRNPQSRRDLASSLRTATHNLTPMPAGRGNEEGPPSPEDQEIDALRRRLRAHPCHACPDREEHARWAERWFKLDRDARTLRRRVDQRTNTVARQFDRVCEVLEALGYVEGDEVTELGRPLRRIYSELDLVVAEALRLGVLDRLPPAGLAAALSTLVYEARRPEDAVAARIPGGETQRVVDDLDRLWRELSGIEREHRLDFLRRPDAGLAWAAYRGAEGDDLADVLGESDLTAGDFVRWVKQLIDLCGQVADAAGPGPLRDNARDVVRRIRRGVVAVAPMED
jgi:ATP-dependent RNA helicase HelY